MTVNYRLYGNRGPYLNAYSMPGFQGSGLNKALQQHHPLDRGFVHRTGGTPAPGQPSAPNPPLAANQPNASWAQRTFGGMREWAQNNRGSVGMLLGGLAKAVTGRRETHASSLYGPVQYKDPNAAQQIAQLGYNAGANRAASDYLRTGDQRHLQFMDPGMAQGLRQERTGTELVREQSAREGRRLDMQGRESASQIDYRKESLDLRWQDLKDRREQFTDGLDFEAAQNSLARRAVVNLENIRKTQREGEIKLRAQLEGDLRRELAKDDRNLALHARVIGELAGLYKVDASNQKALSTAAQSLKKHLMDSVMAATKNASEWADEWDDATRDAFFEDVANQLHAGFSAERQLYVDEEGNSLIPDVIYEDGRLQVVEGGKQKGGRVATPPGSTQAGFMEDVSKVPGLDLAAAFGAITPNAPQPGRAATAEAEEAYPGGVDPATGEKLQIGRQYQSPTDGSVSVLTADGWR